MKTKCFPLELLYKYVDKKLDSDKANELEAHIEHCSTCSDIIKQITCINGGINAVFGQEKLPLGFEQKFYSRLNGPTVKKPSFLFARVAIAVGASAVAMLIIFSANQTGIFSGSEEANNTQIEKKVINKVADDALNYL